MASWTSPASVRSDASYRAFASRCPDGIWCLELSRPISITLPPDEAADLIVRTGRVADANDAAAALLGRSRGYELIGRRLPGLLVHEPGQLRNVLIDFITDGCRLADRRLQLASAGEDRAIAHSLTGIVEGGALVRIWGVQRLATDRRAIAEQFCHVQKMAAVGQLAGSVAHDFNNLLTAIMGYGEMVNEALEPGSVCRSDMEQVLSAARRAEALTRQLLTFRRRRRGRPELFDLNVAVLELEPLLRRLIPEDIEIALALAPGPALVRADRCQLELVIMNLAMNARDAMPHGGRVTIGTAVGIDDAECHDTPTQVRLTVSDTGAGIAREVRTRIFEPFFTTKSGGIGLGLTTAQEIVTQSGGRIEVESEPGCGAIFIVGLDAPMPDADESEEPAPVVRIGCLRSRLDR